jgi:2'-5' RNA ligase
MRLFVAIAPPDEALAQLDAAVAPHRAEWPALRWAKPERWHLTLAFLGDVDEAAVATLHERFAQAATAHPTLDLALYGTGTFPCDRRAHVLWAGVIGARRELCALSDAVADAAKAASSDTAAGPMHPHLTLARTRTLQDLRPLRVRFADFHGMSWQASEFRLIQSTLGAQARYRTLAGYPLGAR